MVDNTDKVFAAIENGKPAYYKVPHNALISINNCERVVTVNGLTYQPVRITETEANQMGCQSVKQSEMVASYIGFLKRGNSSEPKMNNSFSF